MLVDPITQIALLNLKCAYYKAMEKQIILIIHIMKNNGMIP